MKKRSLSFVLALSLCLTAGVAFAGVRLISDVEGAVGGGSSSSQATPAQKCMAEGYRLSSCNGNLQPVNPCPYDSTYFESCCSEEYAFTVEECTQAGYSASRATCGGLHKCM